MRCSFPGCGHQATILSLVRADSLPWPAGASGWVWVGQCPCHPDRFLYTMQRHLLSLRTREGQRETGAA